MNLNVTQAAADRIRSQLRARGKGVGLRLGVKNAGCNGYRYVMDYADEIGSDDVVIEHNGVQVVVDSASQPVVNGAQLDFIREGLNQRFSVTNPRAGDYCGCGSSFTLSEP